MKYHDEELERVGQTVGDSFGNAVIFREKKDTKAKTFVRNMKELKQVLEENREELEAFENVDMSELADKISDNGILISLYSILLELRENRPDERSERSRRYDVVITEMEKVYAYFKTFIIDKAE